MTRIDPSSSEDELPRKKAKLDEAVATKTKATTTKALKITATKLKTNEKLLPFYIMKRVFKYLMRAQLEKIRLVCRLWNRAVATRPSHFKQRHLFENLVFYSLVDGDIPWNLEMILENTFRFPPPSEEMKALARKMTGRLFTSSEDLISIGVKPFGRNWTFCDFPNVLTYNSSLHVINFLWHLRDTAFESAGNCYIGPIFDMDSDMAELFSPIHCRSLSFFEPGEPHDMPETDSIYVPSMESLAAAFKPQKIEWSFNVDAEDSTEVMRNILEETAIDGRALYSQLKIFLHGGAETRRSTWTTLFRQVIKIFSEEVEDLSAVVPIIEFAFCLDCDYERVMHAAFSSEQPIKSKEKWGGRISYTYSFKTKGESMQTYKAKLNCWVDEVEGEDGEMTAIEYVSRIKFKFD